MARNFRRTRSATHPIADLNVTNLIDLGFMLLIIFMVATPLIQQEQTIPVNLPTVSKAPQPSPSRLRCCSLQPQAACQPPVQADNES